MTDQELALKSVRLRRKLLKVIVQAAPVYGFFSISWDTITLWANIYKIIIVNLIYVTCEYDIFR